MDCGALIQNNTLLSWHGSDEEDMKHWRPNLGKDDASVRYLGEDDESVALLSYLSIIHKCFSLFCQLKCNFQQIKLPCLDPHKYTHVNLTSFHVRHISVM